MSTSHGVGNYLGQKLHGRIESITDDSIVLNELIGVHARATGLL